MKRQASALAIRFVTEEYTTPLGVWVTREATRIAMKNKPIKFASKELMLNYAKNYVKRKFGLNSEIIYHNSRLLKSQNQQKLHQFF